MVRVALSACVDGQLCGVCYSHRLGCGRSGCRYSFRRTGAHQAMRKEPERLHSAQKKKKKGKKKKEEERKKTT